MNEKEKRNLIDLISQFGKAKEEIGKNNSNKNLEYMYKLHYQKDVLFSKIINIIKEL